MNEHKTAKLPPYRIGHGYDVHCFGEGDFIVLGGVKIPHHSGFIAHSDGDVLIHALCDALLGAIAAGDIGQHFPDNDKTYENIDSRILLDKTSQIIKQQQYLIINIDTTIVAQQPKMSSHIQAMRQNIADVLHIKKSQINIKATTTEKLGFAGREEGIAVHAVVMLYRDAD
jgi:2-C-methyl-D-erythritol 2,4-cyclodiphosphate synthase